VLGYGEGYVVKSKKWTTVAKIQHVVGCVSEKSHLEGLRLDVVQG